MSSYSEKLDAKKQFYIDNKLEFFNGLCEKVGLDPDEVLDNGIEVSEYSKDPNYNIYVLIYKNINIIKSLNIN